MLSTPENIRTLQRKLYTKAKQEPNFRFYALYDKIWRADILDHAYRLCRANKGSPGIDGISFEAIEQQIGKDTFLSELSQSLQNKTYQPEPVRQVMIPKADGTERPLGIPTIRDRVAQMAVKLVIEPIFEADFSPHSYGFRPEKSAHDAVDDIAKAVYQGYTQVIDADLSKYFDTIPHDKLMNVVAERIVDGAILHIIKQWLKAPVIREEDDGKRRTVGGGKQNRRGTPQGSVISPLLSNCYLNLLDRIWIRNRLRFKLKAHLVRYADDFVVLCRNDVEQPFHVVKRILEKLELNLNEQKTHIINTREDSFDFLGFTIRESRGRVSGKRHISVAPSSKSVGKIKTKITELTQRKRTPIPLPDIVNQVNASLRGWVNYFHYRNSTNAMTKVKWHAEERLRTHLKHRHKIKARKIANGRFHYRVLYEGYGLYPVPTKAAWKQAHA